MPIFTCLVPRPHFSSRPKRFRSRGPCENVRRFPPVRLEYVTKRIDREGLGERRTGPRQYIYIISKYLYLIIRSFQCLFAKLA